MNGTVGKLEIARLIPHDGKMCLLDTVLAWNSVSITCVTSSHRAPDNPLRAGGRVDAVCGIEYASQAMAVHGGLIGDGKRPAAGYLASLRDVVMSVDRLDTLKGDLLVSAELLMAQAGRVIYRFELSCEGEQVLSGVAAVVIDAGSPT